MLSTWDSASQSTARSSGGPWLIKSRAADQSDGSPMAACPKGSGYRRSPFRSSRRVPQHRPRRTQDADQRGFGCPRKSIVAPWSASLAELIFGTSTECAVGGSLRRSARSPQPRGADERSHNLLAACDSALAETDHSSFVEHELDFHAAIVAHLRSEPIPASSHMSLRNYASSTANWRPTMPAVRLMLCSRNSDSVRSCRGR